MKILTFLKSNIKTDTPLLTIVDIFSRMCRIKIDGENEMFLFEVGTVEQNGKTKLLFSMVRQFSDGDDEPIQIHTDLIYNPKENIKNLLTCSWHEYYGDFIQTVLLSDAFETCNNLPIEELDIWIDKT